MLQKRVSEIVLQQTRGLQIRSVVPRNSYLRWEKEVEVISSKEIEIYRALMVGEMRGKRRE